MAEEYEMKISIPNLKIANASTTSNNLVNEKIDHAFKLQNETHASKYSNEYTIQIIINNNSVLQ